MNEKIIELYEQAGKPQVAIIKLSEPTKIATSIRNSRIVTEFKAYITENKTHGLGYCIQPRSYHAFYMPENVVEFVPVDTMELWARAKKAANYIKADKVHGRELNNAFENYDGDEMCAALWRMALKSDKLMTAIKHVWSNGQETFLKNHEKFNHISDKELSEHAQKTREAK